MATTHFEKICTNFLEKSSIRLLVTLRIILGFAMIDKNMIFIEKRKKIDALHDLIKNHCSPGESWETLIEMLYIIYAIIKTSLQNGRHY